jgi:hypothetical protein
MEGYSICMDRKSLLVRMSVLPNFTCRFIAVLIKIPARCGVWWDTPVVTALGRLRQENLEFKDNLWATW